MFDELSPSEGPRIARGMVGGKLYHLIGRKSRHPPLFHESVIQTFPGMEIVVFEIKTLQHGIVPFKPFGLPEGL